MRWVMCKHCTILFKGFQHLRVVTFLGSVPWTCSDGCIVRYFPNVYAVVMTHIQVHHQMTITFPFHVTQWVNQDHPLDVVRRHWTGCHWVTGRMVQLARLKVWAWSYMDSWIHIYIYFFDTELYEAEASFQMDVYPRMTWYSLASASILLDYKLVLPFLPTLQYCCTDQEAQPINADPDYVWN